MNILITGASGFVGQHLINELLKKDYEIYALARKPSKLEKINEKIKILPYNEDVKDLELIFSKQKFDGIIHLASLFLVNHDTNKINELIDSNIKFGTYLLEMSKKHKIKWFINTGTFWQNYNDSEDYNPVNLYAATKEAFINLAKYYTQTSDLIFTTLKLNDTFGPKDTRKKIFNLWKDISQSNEKLQMSKGEQIIDISYIEDVINAYILLIEHLESSKAQDFNNKLFVVSSNEKMTLKELSKLFEEITNTKLNILWGAREYRQREVMIPYAKGKIVPGWEQKYTLKNAIMKTLGIEND